jgi:RimJ/RimL family protein N-acetyltransferase
MVQQPTLHTERLVLRPFALTDAPEVQRLAGDKAVASTTLNIPHPYENGIAEEWIGTHREGFEQGEMAAFAVVLRNGTLVGAIGLHISQRHERAELGYWIGRPYWNQGYCTEAARALLRYGFETLGLNRIQARHFVRNPASGRVMIKVGMRCEGTMRQDVKKWDVFEDTRLYAILKSEYAP